MFGMTNAWKTISRCASVPTTAALLAVAIAGCATPPPTNTMVDPTPAVFDPEAVAPEVGRAFDTLTREGLGSSARLDAAATLLRLARDADRDVAKDALDAILAMTRPGQPGDAIAALCRAVAIDPLAPPPGLAEGLYAMRGWLPVEAEDHWAPAMGRAAVPPWDAQLTAGALSSTLAEAERLRLIRALGHLRTPASFETLLSLTDPVHPKALQDASFAALESQTGLRGLGRDPQAWRQWWQANRTLDPVAYRATLTDVFTRQRLTEAVSDDGLEQRLVQSQRALYRTSSAEDRPAVLVYMLRDALPVIRELAVDLCRERLLDDEPFDGPLRAALRERLADPSAEVRVRATALLRDLMDDPAADLVAERLAKDLEHDRAVLAGSFRLLARMPRAEANDAALDALSRRDLRGPAASALARSAKAELLDRRDGRRAAEQVRRHWELGERPLPEEVVLIGAVVPAKDEVWTRIAQWVRTGPSELQSAAAMAWADGPHDLHLLAQQAGHPVVRPIAYSALTARGRLGVSLSTLAALPPDDAAFRDEWGQALVAVAGRLPAAKDVIPALGRLPLTDANAALRQDMLTAVLDRRWPDEPQAVAILHIERGETRLVRGEPGAASTDFLAAEDQADRLTPALRERRLRGLTQAQLALGRVDDAVQAARQALITPGGTISAGASDDPLIDLMLQSAAQQSRQGRPQQAQALLTGVRRLLGQTIKPELASRIRDLEKDVLTGGLPLAQPRQAPSAPPGEAGSAPSPSSMAPEDAAGPAPSDAVEAQAPAQDDARLTDASER